MAAYENGGHAYHATLPTDALRRVRDAMRDTEAHGFELARSQQWELGRKVRALFAERGFPSVAGAGFEAPGVVVSYTSDPEVQSAKKFIALGRRRRPAFPCNARSRRISAAFASVAGLTSWAMSSVQSPR
jgi:aspartate aminotransferase-like enzyme